MKIRHFKILFFLLSIFLKEVHANENFIKIYNNDNQTDISNKIFIYEDTSSTLTFKDILDKNFTKSKSNVINLGITKSSYWIKIPIINLSDYKELVLHFLISTIDNIEFYHPSKNGYQHIKTGENYPFYHRKYIDPDYLFDLNISKGDSSIFYLKISSNEGIQLPLRIGNIKSTYSFIKKRDILSGIYFGVMMVMILYNLFLFFSVKDKSYLYYVIYIILILLTQTSVQGYTFQYLWPTSTFLAKYSLFIFPSLVGMASMYFMNSFLQLKTKHKTLYFFTLILSIPYLTSIALAFLEVYNISFKIMEINASIVSVFMLITVIHIYKKGFQPAKYFLFAWSIFLIGVIIYILKDLEILPYNNFTRYTMQIGSALETVLLSFALAARINEYKKEKEISQRQAFLALEEKEQLVREQNIMLELKVKERTLELNETLENLKSTQTQLVESEKMASLGQLTAGVAHEINNPINFVSSNIPPLKQDIDDLTSIIDKYDELKNTSEFENKLNEINDFKDSLDYNYLKEELNTIINGIENGAKRTTEIVESLRNFSRLDESDLILADINEGINSTLTILKSRLSSISLDKNLGDLPKIECYPGKLNQVFMNILTNAIEAVEETKNNISNGKISISTSEENDFIKIIIADNGIGMKEEIKQKIFDPFFTTKKVGKGTGLGLSIVYKIIENHKGSIDTSSEVNKGTAFTILISKNIKN